MLLNRKDIEKIQSILDQFPDVELFELERDSSSGIGSVVSMSFSHDVNGVKGSFEIEISGVEDW